VKVDTRPRRRNAPRIAEKSAPAFLQWLRGRPCLVAHCVPSGKIEAAHVDYAGDKGMGTKVSDKFAVPLCHYHHALQHANGWPRFERAYFSGQEGWALAAAVQYWHNWPGRIAWERKLEEGR
jgi:hypothetical protein